MKSILVAAAEIVAIASPAFDKHCPKDVKIIDQAMSTATGLSETQMTEIKSLRNIGDSLHKRGKHGESIKVLHVATSLLGVEPYKP